VESAPNPRRILVVCALMSGWFERWHQRQRDLAQGGDADLVRGNSNRSRFAVGLIGLGFLIGLLDANIRIPGMLRVIVVGTAILTIIAGFLLALWARQERAFLSKPDVEEPPKIFKQ
jgi:hypothetical protein